MNSIKRELDTDAAITFKSLPTFDFYFEFIISFYSFILIWNLNQILLPLNARGQGDKMMKNKGKTIAK